MRTAIWALLVIAMVVQADHQHHHHKKVKKINNHVLPPKGTYRNPRQHKLGHGLHGLFKPPALRKGFPFLKFHPKLAAPHLALAQRHARKIQVNKPKIPVKPAKKLVQKPLRRVSKKKKIPVKKS